MSSGFRIEFNERDLEREVLKAAKSGMEDLAKQYERFFESMRRKYMGQPVSDIKPALRREWLRMTGKSIADPDLTEYAQAISDGTKVKFKVQM